MSVNVTSVAMADFKVIMTLEGYSVGIFEAAWISDRKIARDRSSIFGAMLSIAHELPVLYHITVNGSDDAEDFVVDQMHLSDLPAIAIFSQGGKVEHKGRLDGNGTLDSSLFLAELSRVKENIPMNTSESERRFSEMRTSSPLEGAEGVMNVPTSWPLSIDTIVSLIFGDVRDGDSPSMSISMSDVCEKYDDNGSTSSGNTRHGRTFGKLVNDNGMSCKPLTLY